MRNNQVFYLVIVFVLMVTTLLFGFFIIKEGQSSCWDQYATEEQAILNCEVHE